MKILSLPSPFEFRKLGWRLWYFQNFMLFIPLFLLLPNFFLILFFFRESGAMVGAIINLIFYLALILDLFSVFLICLSVVLEFHLHRMEKTSSLLILLIPVLGSLWILLSFFWRLPFYPRGPFDFGFGFRNIMFLSETSFYNEFLYNPHTPFLFISSSCILFLFLIFQDNFLLFKNQSPVSMSQITVEIGTIFGAVNCFSNFLVFFTFSTLDDGSFSMTSLQLLLFLLCLIFQLLIVPLLGMRTARKYVACVGWSAPYAEPTPSVAPSGGSFRIWVRNRMRVCQSVNLRPSKRTIGILIVLAPLLSLFPFSPFFISNLSPSPYIKGPYISRTVSQENLGVLQYVEDLPLADLTGLHDSYLMTNSTMNFFLEKISTGNSIENGFSPYYYAFNWSVSLIESSSSVLDSSIFPLYWDQISTESHITHLIWWDNGTRFVDDSVSRISRSEFVNFSSVITWVFFGTFYYEEAFGDVGGHFLSGYQLLFLNVDLELVCFAFTLSHAVA
ncbi:MAG: hypothetical protein ACFFDT_25675 [Candidatus Hodarchaeota archaeon]